MADLIERRAAIDALEARIDDITPKYGSLIMHDYDQGKCKGLEIASEILEALPTAEQHTGHWIDRQRVYSELTIGTCSKCGLRVAVGNYCPHCGERMTTEVKR